MIEMAEGLKEAGKIQVQAERYEGYMVWVNALIESAGTEILSGPETVDLEQKPTEEALGVIGKLFTFLRQVAEPARPRTRTPPGSPSRPAKPPS